MPLTDRKRAIYVALFFGPVFAVKNSIFPVHFWSNGGGIKKLNFFLSFILYILNFEGFHQKSHRFIWKDYKWQT